MIGDFEEHMDDDHLPSRRSILYGGGALFAWSFMPKYAHAAASNMDKRFVAIILRGALDGLLAVPPVGDPNYASLRPTVVLPKTGLNAGLKLPNTNFFVLHPALKNLSALYNSGHALIFHSIATSYRERSHFDGQHILESGYTSVRLNDTGWLNRALQNLPQGANVAPPVNGLNLGVFKPLILRGSAPVLGWSPKVSSLPILDGLVGPLYNNTIRPDISTALTNGAATLKLASSSIDVSKLKGMQISAAGAGNLLAQSDGPRIAALAFDGWDTHSNEAVAGGGLAATLAELDGAIGLLQSTMSSVWNQTAILLMTEFGRTAAQNGTGGTDHGTATVAFLIGGAVKGGRVVSNWPGLASKNLYAGRDLYPTSDLRSVIKGVLNQHLGIDKSALESVVFPGSLTAAPITKETLVV